MAAFLTLTRAVASHDDTRVTAFYGPFVAFVVFSFALPAFWVLPSSAASVGLFLAIGCFASLATYLQAQSYRYASTHFVNPFGYLSLVFAATLDWFVFTTTPDVLSIIGMATIVAGGLFMALSSRN